MLLHKPFPFNNINTFSCFGVPHSNSPLKTRADNNIIITIKTFYVLENKIQCDKLCGDYMMTDDKYTLICSHVWVIIWFRVQCLNQRFQGFQSTKLT